MFKKLTTLLFVTCTLTVQAQQPAMNSRKLSPHLVSLTQRQPKPRHMLALMTAHKQQDMASLAAEHGFQLVDSIGRIYIVRLTTSQVARLSTDARIERIEAEPMVRQPAMDVTPGQINATPAYAGTDLPQAFTGKGVVAGVFDNAFDFTHPAFRTADGHTRVGYYYDFCWQNDDGTTGHAMTTADEIEAYGGTQHPGISLHGTHVMGIMAGNAVNGKYQGMAPEADIYAVHFNSMPADFESPDETTSANCVLGFKYIFDQAAAEGKPCVVNFSSGESVTLSNQRLLESEALQALTGPGRIITVCAGNDGTRSCDLEKPADVLHAGAAIVNGIGGGDIIDFDIITPGNQLVRLDFLGIRLTGLNIENTITFNTDSVLSLQDTCRLETTLSMGTVQVKAWRNDIADDRGDVIHVYGHMPNPVYLVLCGGLCLLTGNSPAWVYSDIKYCPFVNLNGVNAYSYAQPGHSLWWPGTLPGLITVGATGYKSSFRDIDGNINNQMDEFGAPSPGLLAAFSSQGPTFDGLVKPDVVAPGVSINAAFNSYIDITAAIRKELTDQVEYNGKTYYYTAQTGTSMATPVAAGAIALWLQAKPDLTPDEIIDVFAHTCTQPDPSLSYPNSTYGYGQIDVYKGLLYVLNLETAISELSSHQPEQARFHLEGRRLVVEGLATTPQQIELSVYNMNGQKVASTHQTAIDLTSLPSGIYAVQLNTGQKATTGSTLIRL